MRGLSNEPLAAEMASLIEFYADTIQRNRGLLPNIVAKIEVLNAKMNVAFWGATTIFDLLVKYGGLSPTSVRTLVDTYLHKFAKSTHGVPIQSPDVLRRNVPDVCIVLARFSSKVIERDARSFGVRNVITFEQLISSEVKGFV